MNKTKTFLLITFLTFILKSYCQNVYDGIPDNLNAETIIFLEYEQLDVEKAVDKSHKRMFKFRNEMSILANEQLNTYAKEYPFKYVISRRSEYKDSLSKTCRYVLDNELMENYNNGINNYAGYKKEFYSPMYILDLKTGDRYNLFNLYSKQGYNYKGIIKAFSKKVRKKFNIKKK